jgi:hypothetical protein
VDAVDLHLYNPLNPHPSLSQYPHNVLAALLRLICDAALDQVALCIGGDLARDEDLGTRDDGLGLYVLSVSCLITAFCLVLFKSDW